MTPSNAPAHGSSPSSAAPQTAATLWQPFNLAGHLLANRVVVAPMSRVSTRGDGVPTDQMQDYYREFARGGFGLIITEGIYPVGPASQGYTNQPALVTAAQVHGWSAVTDAVHNDGGVIIAQIMHAGALSQHLQDTVGPSAIPPRGMKMPEYEGSGPYPTPTALNSADIDAIIAGFAASAELAVDAGFDGIEIHASNGYLLDQFITGYTNTRSDRYGGSPTARALLTADVISAVRKGIGSRKMLGVRLSQAKVNDSHHQWQDADEATQIFDTIAGAGPDYIHLAGEGRPWTESGHSADGTLLGTLARERTGLPVIVNGGLHTPQLIDQVLGSGEADLVSIARPALADPHWPTFIRAGATPRPFHRDMISPASTLQNTADFLHALTARTPA